MQITQMDKSRLAKTDKELRSLASSDADWFARTADDVRQLREVGNNPFAKLPETDFNAFLSTLTFENGGLAGGCYKPLMYTLTLSEIFEIFAYFGFSIEMLTRDDSGGCLECKPSDCSFSFWDLCTGITKAE
jgi:hypothetical protein